MNWGEVTAVFGGTFDPPHLGHREAVRGLFKFPGVKRVLIVPSGTPPLKPQATSTEHRFKMTRLNFGRLENVEIDAREKDRYTFDTLMELRQKHPVLAFVVGADQLAALHTWHRFPELLQASHWLVLARKPDGEAIALKTLAEWEASGLVRKEGSEWSTQGSKSQTQLRVVPTEAPAVSSTEIREKIAKGTGPEGLHPEVLTYLMEHRIYGMTHNLKDIKK